ncbi:hypothetical protein [Nocardia sp. NPDC024068]|uniref:hypothetical protein n=1 Tax=Nocardia sp. NPDC024068 TaxID=3157197 RepID=UPI0033E701BE
MSRNTNQLSVAELLARNGQQPTASGGRRRRGGRGVSVEELSGDLPVVENGASAHAAPDTDDPPAEYAAGPSGADGYAPDGYAGEHLPYPAPDPNYSPMSGPISVYNPLAPYGSDPGAGDAPARLGDPSGGSWPEQQPPPEDDASRSAGGRRRRAEPDDDFDNESAGANRTWEPGPPTPGGGRAARRRAAEAAEAAAAAESAAEVARQSAPEEYGRPGDFGGFAPDFGSPDYGPPAAPPDFGRPDSGPSWPDRAPGFEAGPPRLGPPGAAPTETWQPPEPGPAPDSRPKLERRRRGASPVPEPAPWPDHQPRPEEQVFEQATVMWPVAEQDQRPPFGPPGVDAPSREEPWHRPGRGPGGHEGHPAPADPGFPDPGGPTDFGSGFGDSGSYATDMFATDVHGPMRPVSGPVPRDRGPETGDFESDFAPEPDRYEDREEAESRLARGRAALTGRLGVAGGKFAGARERLAGRERAEDSDAPVDPRKQWIMLGVQSVGAALVGMVLFKGFEQLWEMQPLAALALAVVVILGLVALVRILRRTDDIFSTVIAVVVGVFVTLGPLAFLLSTG